MMVAGFDVQLWDTTTWKLKGAHKFDNLGRSFWTGDRITPWTQLVPGRPQVAVFSIHAGYYWPVLRWLGRVGRLNTFGTGQVSLINASAGTRQRIELHEIDAVATRETPYGHRNVLSPDGDTLALTMLFTGEVVIWDLPPRPSYVAPSFAAVLVALAALLLFAIRWRMQKRPRSTPQEPTEPALAAAPAGKPGSNGEH